MKAWPLLLTLWFVPTASAAPALRDVVPASTQTAANVVPQLDPEAAGIAAQYAAAIASRQDWLRGYAAQHANVALTTGLLPYHPNMGISPAAYQKVTQSLRQMDFVAVGDGRLRVERQGDRLRLSAPDGQLGPTLTQGLTVDLAASTVTLAELPALDRPVFEDGHNIMKTMGSYVPGYVFKREQGSERIRVTFGQITSDPGHCLLSLLVQAGARRDFRHIRYACAGA